MSGPERIFIKGQRERDRPLIVFINGMGVDINIWKPSATKVLGNQPYCFSNK